MGDLTFMDRFNGILLISGNQSSVNGELLLMAGVPDAQQAMSAATAFVQGKGFRNGDAIVVIGVRGQVGSVSGILMSDAVPPPRTATQAVATPAFAAATPQASAKRPAIGQAKKKAAKKKAATAKKESASERDKSLKKNPPKKGAKTRPTGKKSKGTKSRK
jgi:hypothetical protein